MLFAAIGSCSWRRYHKDRAYEMELYRERQRRQRIRDQRQARLLSNQSGQDKLPLSSTAERHESASPKRKPNVFTWSSPYWKGSRSQSLKKKLYGRRMKIVKVVPVVSRYVHEVFTHALLQTICLLLQQFLVNGVNIILLCWN